MPYLRIRSLKQPYQIWVSECPDVFDKKSTKKSTKNQPKINQKINQKSTKNQPKINQKSTNLCCAKQTAMAFPSLFETILGHSESWIKSGHRNIENVSKNALKSLFEHK
jgi:hypothetical protein